MATEHTCTEMVHESELAHEAGRYVEHGTRRHVAFTVVEQLLYEALADEVTFTLTISRRSVPGGRYVFTASGRDT